MVESLEDRIHVCRNRDMEPGEVVTDGLQAGSSQGLQDFLSH